MLEEPISKLVLIIKEPYAVIPANLPDGSQGRESSFFKWFWMPAYDMRA